MMTRLVVLAITACCGLLIGFLGLALVGQIGDTGPRVTLIHGQWDGRVQTVAQQALEADVVVRARVVGPARTRKTIDELPPEVQKSGLAGQVTPFTDTGMRVLEVYKGSIAAEIDVMQLGGELPEVDGHPRLRMEDEEDPLYLPDGEYVLFLNDITGDHIHAPNRKLYNIVNPLGRYDVSGDRAATHAATANFRPPATLAALEARIRDALAATP